MTIKQESVEFFFFLKIVETLPFAGFIAVDAGALTQYNIRLLTKEACPKLCMRLSLATDSQKKTVAT